MEFKSSTKLVAYQDALNIMEERVKQILLGNESELIWFLEHPALITAGSSANKADLLNDFSLPIYQTGRGGGYTYHGPGQRVVYLMLDLKKRAAADMVDIRKYVYNLEQIIINSLLYFNIKAKRITGKIGIWVDQKLQSAKIAAIGIRVRRWVTYHGIAINIDPDLNNFNYIIPCGIKELGVTSLKNLNANYTKEQFDLILKQEIYQVFGYNKL